MLTRYSTVALLVLVGCGGGGSDDQAVSSNPPASPPPVAATPAPQPPAAPPPRVDAPSPIHAPAPKPDAPAPSPEPSPAPSPAPVPPPGEAPVPPPADVPRVDGELVLAALQTGISGDPQYENVNPYLWGYRMLRSPDGYSFFLGGRMSSMTLGTGDFGGGPRPYPSHEVSIKPLMSDGVIYEVTVNGISMTGPALNLRTVDPAIDQTAGAWANGQWYAYLVIQSGGADAMRVCWNVYAPITLYPPGNPAPPPTKRLMCGIYSKSRPGPDQGGYMVLDTGSEIVTYTGAW